MHIDFLNVKFFTVKKTFYNLMFLFQFELNEDVAQKLVRDVEEKLAELMNEDVINSKDLDNPQNTDKPRNPDKPSDPDELANPNVELGKSSDMAYEADKDLNPKLDGHPEMENAMETHSTKDQSEKGERNCHLPFNNPMDFNPFLIKFVRFQ